MTRRILADIESELSQRELQLLTLASQGLTDQAIAHELAISLATIATYWGRIRIKLGPLNRTELVAKYLGSKSQGTIADLQNEVEMLRAKLEATKQEDLDMLMTLSKAPDAILVLDDKGCVVYANEAACYFMGYSQSELLGQSYLEFYPKERHHLWNAWFKRVLETRPQGGDMEPIISYTRHKDGNIRLFNVTCSTFETKEGLRIITNARLEQGESG